MMNGILVACDDLELRIHHQSQMQAAGLHGILENLRSFGHMPLDKLLKIFQQTLDENEKNIRERFDQGVLDSFHDSPEDVLKALQVKTGNSKAKDHLLSILQHLLLIQEDGSAMTHHFQLIDSLVADIVLDKKLAGAERRLGQSVERIIAQFNEAERSQAEGANGMIDNLKGQIGQLEEGLRVARSGNSRFREMLETQRVGHEKQVAQLEAQIMELFKMLKDVRKDAGEEAFNTVQADSGEPEIQRRVNEMDKAGPVTFYPSPPRV